MLLNDLKRLIQPLRNKIFLLLGRAILEAVKNTELAQKIQVTALNGEVISDMERFQEYGFETYPLEGAEVAAIFLNGNRDHGIAICVHDRRYRPQNLAEGETALYTDEDEPAQQHRVHLKRGQIIELVGGAGAVGGVITNQSLDPFTGNPHIDPSTKIKASK